MVFGFRSESTKLDSQATAGALASRGPARSTTGTTARSESALGSGRGTRTAQEMISLDQPRRDGSSLLSGSAMTTAMKRAEAMEDIIINKRNRDGNRDGEGEGKWVESDRGRASGLGPAQRTTKQHVAHGSVSLSNDLNHYSGWHRANHVDLNQVVDPRSDRDLKVETVPSGLEIRISHNQSEIQIGKPDEGIHKNNLIKNNPNTVPRAIPPPRPAPRHQSSLGQPWPPHPSTDAPTSVIQLHTSPSHGLHLGEPSKNGNDDSTTRCHGASRRDGEAEGGGGGGGRGKVAVTCPAHYGNLNNKNDPNANAVLQSACIAASSSHIDNKHDAINVHNKLSLDSQAQQQQQQLDFAVDRQGCMLSLLPLSQTGSRSNQAAGNIEQHKHQHQDQGLAAALLSLSLSSPPSSSPRGGRAARGDEHDSNGGRNDRITSSNRSDTQAIGSNHNHYKVQPISQDPKEVFASSPPSFLSPPQKPSRRQSASTPSSPSPSSHHHLSFPPQASPPSTSPSSALDISSNWTSTSSPIHTEGTLERKAREKVTFPYKSANGSLSTGNLHSSGIKANAQKLLHDPSPSSDHGLLSDSSPRAYSSKPPKTPHTPSSRRNGDPLPTQSVTNLAEPGSGTITPDTFYSANSNQSTPEIQTSPLVNKQSIRSVIKRKLSFSSPKAKKKDLFQDLPPLPGAPSTPGRQVLGDSPSMLSPPKPAFLARSTPSSPNFSSLNASVTSFTSSGGEGNGTPSLRNSSSSRGGCNSSSEADLHSNGLWLDSAGATIDPKTHEGVDRERGGGPPSRSKSKTRGESSTFGEGGVTLKGLGRRFFSRSSSNQPNASRSQSSSSAGTSRSSPPLTPTTPPPVPLWLPNGTKDFFGDSLSLPPLSIGNPGASSASLGGSMDQINIKSPLPRLSERGSSLTGMSTSRAGLNGPAGSAASTPPLSPHLPVVPEATFSPLPKSLEVLRSHAPAEQPVSELLGEADSEFLRAVLNFGSEESATRPIPSSSVRSFSLNLSADRYSSVGFGNQQRMQRGPHGKVVMTQAEARCFSESIRLDTKPKFSVRPGLFRRNSDDSEDEYGEDDSHLVSAPTSPARGESSLPTLPVYPSSFSATKPRSPSPKKGWGERVQEEDEEDDEVERLVNTLGPGLDTPSKRALYTCTLLKVHPHLASKFTASPDGKLIPAARESSTREALAEIRYPRSINLESRLRQHHSTHAFTRDLGVAVARTLVMKKLRRVQLPIEQEVEVSWFQRKYGTEIISPDEIMASLASRAMVSPEALARPPVMTPNYAIAAASEKSSEKSFISSESTSPDSLGDQVKASFDPDHNGLALWTSRPGFSQRCVMIRSEDTFTPGDVLSGGVSLVAKRSSLISAQVSIKPQPINFSPRVRLLAGLPSLEEERKLKYTAPARFRPRESRRESRLLSASEPGPASENSRLTPGSVARPDREDRRKESRQPPPWIAPRNPLHLNPVAALGMPQPSAPVCGNLGKRMSNASLPRPHDVAMVRKGASYHGMEPASNLLEEDEDDSRSDASSEEEVPLARLSEHRSQRNAERERLRKLEEEIAELKKRERERDVEEQARKKREEEEAQRIESERRKAKEEARATEKNRKILQEARERRERTRHSALLASSNYGAGSPLGPIKPASTMSPPKSVSRRASQQVLPQSFPSMQQLAIQQGNMVIPSPPHQQFHALSSSPPSFYASPALAHSLNSVVLPHQFHPGGGLNSVGLNNSQEYLPQQAPHPMVASINMGFNPSMSSSSIAAVQQQMQHLARSKSPDVTLSPTRGGSMMQPRRRASFHPESVPEDSEVKHFTQRAASPPPVIQYSVSTSHTQQSLLNASRRSSTLASLDSHQNPGGVNASMSMGSIRSQDSSNPSSQQTQIFLAQQRRFQQQPVVNSRAVRGRSSMGMAAPPLVSLYGDPIPASASQRASGW
ncbi:hypothetical protein IE53DRAFT_44312 [Violaceomyces palustris]|uniref:Uncharacterized protein n=1 Tax=Violaceomyces palustris TaxID=1673888 RepID=A0ACD0P7N7_9BASI|nr:hypothetical protein IE53DRAFT_44312 [Violaceomyces palustris]